MVSNIERNHMRSHHHHHHHDDEDRPRGRRGGLPAAGLAVAIVTATQGTMEGEGWRGRGRGRGHFGPGPGGPRGRGRARRGDVRAAILALLGEQPMHGYQIIQELESRSNGLWRPSPGSVYPTLQLFEDEGLVSASEVEGRRVFDLTDAGRERLAEAGPAGATPWDDVARETPQDVASLRDGIRALMAATHQVAHAGSAKQSERALEVLSDARRKIYSILAEDEKSSGDDA
jgi:DNA-binding PadR family transcriptional regulator